LNSSEDTSRDLKQGVVIRSQSGHCEVIAEGESWHCRLRGRLKRGAQQSRTVSVVGDNVLFQVLDDSAGQGREGVIEEVLPRRNKISRMSSKRDRGRIEQVIMANLDQVLVVQSLTRPNPVDGFVDRMLVTAERYGVKGVVCLNKLDLMPVGADDPRWAYYETIGYPVLKCSAETGEGVNDFGAILKDRISLLLGASGTGKSSLLAAATGMDLRVGDVTDKTGLGRHTTTRTEIFPLDGGGYIADSPGIRGFDPWDIEPVELRRQFPDMDEPGHRCRFQTCLHRDEPRCGVKQAVKLGVIPEWRHQAYLALLGDIEERKTDTYRKRRE
jgi:ribosome biogenesis GTPase / thiamine phosphate phosphatase